MMTPTQIFNLYASNTTTAATTTASTNVFPWPTTTSSTTMITVPIGALGQTISIPVITVLDGEAKTINLPDGSVINVKPDGSFTIDDKDAKVTYRANRVREFNSFLNASDKLEAFIRFCGTVGVKQDEMLNIPVKHFIAWLIVEAARADGEQPMSALPDLRQHAKHPRCSFCGRFIPRG